MNRLSDTHPNAARVQLELMRSFSPEKKRNLTSALSSEMIQRSRQHIAMLHNLNEQAATLEWIRTHYGADIATKLLNARVTLGTNMNTELKDALNLALQAMKRIGVNCRVVGSMASAELGISRTTWDADVVAALEMRHVQPLVAALGNEFYADAELIREGIQNGSSFNLIHLESALKVDVFMPKNREYDWVALSRFNPNSPDFMTAEDVLLGKLEWYRAGDETSERQWTDVIGILQVQAEHFDLEYARRWAQEIGVLDLLEKAIGEA
jgi:hypothetical protein